MPDTALRYVRETGPAVLGHDSVIALLSQSGSRVNMQPALAPAPHPMQTAVQVRRQASWNFERIEADLVVDRIIQKNNVGNPSELRILQIAEV